MQISKFDYIVDGASLLGLLFELAGISYGVWNFLDYPVFTFEDICLQVFFYGPVRLFVNLGLAMLVMIVPFFLLILFCFNVGAVSNKRDYNRQKRFLYRRTNAIWLNISFIVFAIICGFGLFVGVCVAGSRF